MEKSTRIKEYRGSEGTIYMRMGDMARILILDGDSGSRSRMKQALRSKNSGSFVKKLRSHCSDSQTPFGMRGVILIETNDHYPSPMAVEDRQDPGIKRHPTV